jgi:6-phosphogluconolactonase
MAAASTKSGARECAVYVAHSGDGTIAAFSMDCAHERPRKLQTIAIAGGDIAGGMSTPMALSPDRGRLYAAVRKAPLPITSFAIDRADGTLTALATARLPASTPFLAVDRNGRFLISAANVGATVAVSAIDGEGLVGPRAHQVLHIGHKLHCIAVDAANAHAYVSSTDDGRIYQFGFDAAAGLLAPLAPFAVRLEDGGDPRHMVLSPGGRFMYVTTEAGGRVACLAVDQATGQLAERPGAAMMPDGFSGHPWTADIHLTGDGRHLYASARSLRTIVGYRVDPATGALTPIGSVVNDGRPRAFAIAPDDTFMLVAGEDTGTVSAYGIDRETGTLAPGVRFETGPGPNWIEFVPLGGA